MHISSDLSLICPLCRKILIINNNQLCCENGHSFDIARQGYVNLLPVQHKKSKEPGDSKEMISARQQFLQAGFYQPISEQLNKIIQSLLLDKNQANILDAGCGEGYYLNRCHQHHEINFPDKQVSFLGLDISKPAIMTAAKQYKSITWVVGTNKAPPVMEQSIDIVLCMFGFCDLDIISTILKPDGKVILVDAGSDHLLELRRILYPHLKDSRQKNNIPEFVLADEQRVKFTVSLNQKQISDLLIMTPHLYRASKEGKEDAKNLKSIDLTVDAVFRVLQKNIE